MAKKECRSVLVTGGAGFIGSNFARYLLRSGYDRVRVFDKLTYAGNPENFDDLNSFPGFSFHHGDICDPHEVAAASDGFDAIVNFAAETHVDRSLLNPGEFIQTDVYGVYVLLETVRNLDIKRFVHVSTDEVYGHIRVGSFKESDPLHPRNPYSASKAGGEMMVNAYVETFGVPAVISRGSNTYGPYQFPEKLLPLTITNLLEERIVPVYGDGKQVRDWLHVYDHVRGIELLMREGELGETYNLGGNNERHNIDVVEAVLNQLDAPAELIQHVTDRRGHDVRYSLDTSKIQKLGWQPEVDFNDGLAETVQWYRGNSQWWKPTKSADEFHRYYQENYSHRENLGNPSCSK